MIVTPGNPRQPWRRRNPHGETPDRFRERTRLHVVDPGRTPGTMEFDDRETSESGLAPGTIRRLWQQTIAGMPAPPPVNVAEAPAIFTRSLRYRAQSLYRPAGSMNTRFSNLHTVIKMAVRQPRATLEAGTRRGRPVVRNRMASFGSRVQPLNRHAPAARAEKQ